MSGTDSPAVWLLAVGQTLIYAGCYYSFPALLPDLEAATGWTKAELALGPTLAFLIMAGLATFTGRLVDRGMGARCWSGCRGWRRWGWRRLGWWTVWRDG